MGNIEKKILLAVDDSINSKNAVRYCINMSSFIKELTYTLFHIQPAISGFLLDEAKTNMKAQSNLVEIKKENTRKSEEMLQELKAEMVGMGIDAGRIEIKSETRKLGLDKDIIEHAQKGRYDALVAGRRGFSRVQEVFMGSTTAKLVEHSQVIPLWVVDGQVESQKILVAVDGSESALRAVDHVSFIVGGSPNVEITLVHVIPKLGDYCPIDFEDSDGEVEYIISQGDKKCIESFMSHTYRRFQKAGIPEDRIEVKKIKKTMGRVGRTIMEEAQKGDYGTIVMGRRGVNKAFFMGSVSNYIFSRTTDRAIWLVT
ncbi:MAG: universal stress protein [Thermodesulfobacteriota bacterium]